MNVVTGALGGVVLGWSVATPWSGQPIWWLQLVAMAWLVRQLSVPRSPSVAAVQIALPFVLGWLTSSLWWLYTSMHDYGGLAAPLAVVAVLALCAFLGSFYVIACAVYVRLTRPLRQALPPSLKALLFAALWLLAELLRGSVLSGFPWAAIGYAHIEGPFAALAPWVGVYGIAFATAFVAAWFILTPSCAVKWLLIAILLLRSFEFGSPPPTEPITSTSKPLNVRLLQGNIPQNEKFNNTLGVDVALAWYSEQLLKAAADGVDVVVTPETAIPVLPTRLPAGYWDSLQLAFAQQTTTVGMVGVPLLTGSNGYTNSVVGLGGAAYRYDKQHLVPFGEFIPPFFRWFTDLMNIPLGDFARGDLAQPSLSHQSWRLAPNICFEDLFGEELAARFANPNSAPHVLVNISNMGWFAKPNQSSLAIDQHIGISRMRALEFDRPVIRATNTGATAIINRQGVVVQSLARGQRGVLNGTLDNRSEAITAYAQWASKFWLWPLFAWSLSVVGLALFWRRSDRF